MVERIGRQGFSSYFVEAHVAVDVAGAEHETHGVEGAKLSGFGECFRLHLVAGAPLNFSFLRFRPGGLDVEFRRDPAIRYEPDERDDDVERVRNPLVEEGQRYRRCVNQE